MPLLVDQDCTQGVHEATQCEQEVRIAVYGGALARVEVIKILSWSLCKRIAMAVLLEAFREDEETASGDIADLVQVAGDRINDNELVESASQEVCYQQHAPMVCRPALNRVKRLVREEYLRVKRLLISEE